MSGLPPAALQSASYERGDGRAVCDAVDNSCERSDKERVARQQRLLLTSLTRSLRCGLNLTAYLTSISLPAPTACFLTFLVRGGLCMGAYSEVSG